jgi:integrase
MALFKRGRVFWYHFLWNGQHIQRSTKTRNAKAAQSIEAAYRTALAKGEAGIFERKPAPTLTVFSKRFLEAVAIRSASKPGTVLFYESHVKRLLEYEPLANAPLNQIDEKVVENFIQSRSADSVRRHTRKGVKHCDGRLVSLSTVNRDLATLRRMIRLAQEWRLIDRVPRIRLIAGEKNREYVISHAEEMAYLGFAPQPLKDIATLLLDTGLRLSEALTLEWRDVHITTEGPQRGYICVRQGKSRNARRNVPLTSRACEMLEYRRNERKSPFVFGNEDKKPYHVTSLDHLHAKMREMLKLPPTFVLHSLRHTYLTRLGLAGVEAFTIMKLAGHSSVTVSQRYVHPTPQAMEDAVGKLDN